MSREKAAFLPMDARSPAEVKALAAGEGRAYFH